MNKFFETMNGLYLNVSMISKFLLEGNCLICRNEEDRTYTICDIKKEIFDKQDIFQFFTDEVKKYFCEEMIEVLLSDRREFMRLQHLCGIARKNAIEKYKDRKAGVRPL